MRILVTGRELLDKCLWDNVCQLKGLNEYVFNEGLAEPEEYEVELTVDEAKQLGLLNE